MAAAWPLHAMSEDHPDLPEWAREPVVWVQQMLARVEELERALGRLADGDVPGVGDSAICRPGRHRMQAFARAALASHPTEEER